MPKNITATNVVIEALQVQTDGAGAVTGLVAIINVGYGETRAREQYDLWPELSATQRDAFNQIYQTLNDRLVAAYLS